jgi:hypothetical protein
VPLVQGSIRYLYKCRNGITCSAKAIGEMAAFVASVIPQVHKCSATAAATIATAADPAAYTCTDASSCTGSSNDFTKVKKAFEECYPSMGITCKLVGGLYDKDELKYEELAAPCSDLSTADEKDELSTGGIIGIAVGGGLAVLFLLCLCLVICREKAGKPIFTNLVDSKPSA